MISQCNSNWYSFTCVFTDGSACAADCMPFVHMKMPASKSAEKSAKGKAKAIAKVKAVARAKAKAKAKAKALAGPSLWRLRAR